MYNHASNFCHWSNSCIRSVSFTDINYVQMTQIILFLLLMDYQYPEEHFPQLKLVATELLRICFGMEIQRVQVASFTHPCYYNAWVHPIPWGEGRGMVHTTYLTFTNQNESFGKGFQSHWRWFTLPASNVSWLVCHAYKLQRWVKFLIIIKYYTLSLEKTIDR